MPGHFRCCCSIRSAPATNGIEVFVSVSRLWIAAVALVKSTVFPLVVRCFISEVGAPGTVQGMRY